jgi:hypothetical protein
MASEGQHVTCTLCKQRLQLLRTLRHLPWAGVPGSAPAGGAGHRYCCAGRSLRCDTHGDSAQQEQQIQQSLVPPSAWVATHVCTDRQAFAAAQAEHACVNVKVLAAYVIGVCVLSAKCVRCAHMHAHVRLLSTCTVAVIALLVELGLHTSTPAACFE